MTKARSEINSFIYKFRRPVSSNYLSETRVARKAPKGAQSTLIVFHHAMLRTLALEAVRANFVLRKTAVRVDGIL